jgi:hypothetical protein
MTCPDIKNTPEVDYFLLHTSAGFFRNPEERRAGAATSMTQRTIFPIVADKLGSQK